ncbi:ImmA/IrrE family metallo-endopeptidase [Jeotgalibaca porci]|uniref:ImmA/IrrE family metallo-endopeptidase n=1 Tax=Jeotgalibaca porci TaxID=1868793 RepID=UPI0035A1038F
MSCRLTARRLQRTTKTRSLRLCWAEKVYEVIELQHIREKLKNIEVELYLLDMEGKGYYIPEWRKIFINQRLPGPLIKIVILHELKHAITHSEYSLLYRSFNFRLKMEKEANQYMLDETIKEHEGDYNYSLVNERFNLGMGYEYYYKEMKT